MYRHYLNSDTPIELYKRSCGSPYVDKTLMIRDLSKRINTNNRYICVTRPRRFGKTMIANMLASYFAKGYDTKELFEGLNISKVLECEKHRNQHQVMYIPFNRSNHYEIRSCQQYIDYITKCIQSDLYEAYPAICGKEYHSLRDMFLDTKDSFIFICDGWDSILFESYMQEKDKKAYLTFLRELFIDQRYVELVYISGVFPISKYTRDSVLEMFEECKFCDDPHYDIYFGFCEEEVKKLCDEYQTVNFDDLKKWYEGYHLHDGRRMYNPWSITCALHRKTCYPYWLQAGPGDEVLRIAEENIELVEKDIEQFEAGMPVEGNYGAYCIASYENITREDVLSTMVAYGFLSYDKGKYYVPNYELMLRFQGTLEILKNNKKRTIVLD